MDENVKLRSTIEVTVEDVPSGTVLSVRSWANTVKLPAALKVTEKVPLPPDRAASGGSVALPSVLRICIRFETELTRFQLESHARTVTVNGTPSVCARGVPVLPLAVPGAGLSPGSSTWIRV